MRIFCQPVAHRPFFLLALGQTSLCNYRMKVHCPSCNQRIEADDDLGGEVIVCPACNEAMTLPPNHAGAQFDKTAVDSPVASEPRSQSSLPNRSLEKLSNELKCVSCRAVWELNDEQLRQTKFTCPNCKKSFKTSQGMRFAQTCRTRGGAGKRVSLFFGSWIAAIVSGAVLGAVVGWLKNPSTTQGLVSGAGFGIAIGLVGGLAAALKTLFSR